MPSDNRPDVDVFRCHLIARRPARNIDRSYQVAVSTDLFGAFVADFTYGRTGTTGRTITVAALDLDTIRKHVIAALKRRVSAPKRIGVSYRFCAVHDPAGWIDAAGLRFR